MSLILPLKQNIVNSHTIISLMKFISHSPGFSAKKAFQVDESIDGNLTLHYFIFMTITRNHINHSPLIKKYGLGIIFTPFYNPYTCRSDLIISEERLVVRYSSFW